MKKLLTGMVILLGSFTCLFSIEQIESVKSLTNQEQKQYSSKIESITNTKISALNKQISMYSTLLPISDLLKYKPERTFMKKVNDATSNEKYLELEMYSFIPQKFGSFTNVGQRILMVRIYYGTNQEATRIRTKYTNQNFLSSKITIVILDDKNPSLTAENNHDHIMIQHFESRNSTKEANAIQILNTTLGKISQTFESPYRNEIKSTFYNTHLSKVVRNLHDTSVFHKKFSNDEGEGSLNNLMTAYPTYGM